MSGQARDKRGRRPTAMPPEEMAAILGYAKLHGIPKAAEKYNVSDRTITRWNAKLRDNRLPEVAALVAQQSALVEQRRGDAICEALDELLTELRLRKDKLANDELIEAVDKVGNLRITREALTGGAAAATNVPSDGRRPHADQPGPSSPAGERPHGGGASGASGGPGDGRDAAIRH